MHHMLRKVCWQIHAEVCSYSKYSKPLIPQSVSLYPLLCTRNLRSCDDPRSRVLPSDQHSSLFTQQQTCLSLLFIFYITSSFLPFSSFFWGIILSSSSNYSCKIAFNFLYFLSYFSPSFLAILIVSPSSSLVRLTIRRMISLHGQRRIGGG